MSTVASTISLYEQVDNRNESLIIAHMPMVKRVAIHLKARIPPFMELDELILQTPVLELELFDLAGELPELTFEAVHPHEQFGRILRLSEGRDECQRDREEGTTKERHGWGSEAVGIAFRLP